jgi:hypothetical protein
MVAQTFKLDYPKIVFSPGVFCTFVNSRIFSIAVVHCYTKEKHFKVSVDNSDVYPPFMLKIFDSWENHPWNRSRVFVCVGQASYVFRFERLFFPKGVNCHSSIEFIDSTVNEIENKFPRLERIAFCALLTTLLEKRVKVEEVTELLPPTILKLCKPILQFAFIHSQFREQLLSSIQYKNFPKTYTHRILDKIRQFVW